MVLAATDEQPHRANGAHARTRSTHPCMRFGPRAVTLLRGTRHARPRGGLQPRLGVQTQMQIPHEQHAWDALQVEESSDAALKRRAVKARQELTEWFKYTHHVLAMAVLCFLVATVLFFRAMWFLIVSSAPGARQGAGAVRSGAGAARHATACGSSSGQRPRESHQAGFRRQQAASGLVLCCLGQGVGLAQHPEEARAHARAPGTVPSSSSSSSSLHGHRQVRAVRVMVAQMIKVPDYRVLADGDGSAASVYVWPALLGYIIGEITQRACTLLAGLLRRRSSHRVCAGHWHPFGRHGRAGAQLPGEPCQMRRNAEAKRKAHRLCWQLRLASPSFARPSAPRSTHCRRLHRRHCHRRHLVSGGVLSSTQIPPLPQDTATRHLPHRRHTPPSNQRRANYAVLALNKYGTPQSIRHVIFFGPPTYAAAEESEEQGGGARPPAACGPSGSCKVVPLPAPAGLGKAFAGGEGGGEDLRQEFQRTARLMETLAAQMQALSARLEAAEAARRGDEGFIKAAWRAVGVRLAISSGTTARGRQTDGFFSGFRGSLRRANLLHTVQACFLPLVFAWKRDPSFPVDPCAGALDPPWRTAGTGVLPGRACRAS